MDERSRLDALYSYAILDTPPEADFDRLASLAAFICKTPMAAISFIDETRQWFKSVHGFSLLETARSNAFCNHTIKTCDSLIVRDARNDSRFAGSPLVSGAPWLCFYAGIPLISPEGHALGTLSVMDSVARELSNEQLGHLATLAGQVMEKLELQRLGRSVAREKSADNFTARLYGAGEDNGVEKNLEERQWNEHFNQFANAMPVVVWTARPDGKTSYVNRMFNDFTGLDYENLVVNQFWLTSLHREDLESTQRIWDEAITSGRTFLTEFRVRRYDGRYRWHLVRAVPIRDVRQRVVKWYGTAIDIHDRNVSEANAQRMAERLGTILESITDAFITVDRDWQFTYINTEAERLLQRSREELKGKSIWEEFPATIASDFEHYYRMAMAEGRKVSFEALYPPLKTWFSVNVYPSREGLAIYFQNINARRSAQEQLTLLQTCVAHMTDMVIITEAEPQEHPGRRILFVNEAFVKRTGYTREEVIGRSPQFLKGPKTQEPALQRIREALKKWRPIREELINYTKAGEEFWIDIDLVPIADSAGRFTHWVAVQRDIGERKQAEIESARFVELEQAQRLSELANNAKSHFLATMSHEIRTPISGVIGMVEVLHQTSLKGYQVEMVDIIRDSAQSLLGIIEDILDFSKIEAGKLDLESAPINLFDSVRSVCSILDRFADSKQVELTLFCDPELPETVLGDDLRLRQVLLNLVNNAIKFSSGPGRSGRVSLRVSLMAADKERVSISFLVIDNGIGMDGTTLARLFNPFVQADVSTTRHFGGTGLGLTICRHLVELMGGKIKVESELERGSSFEVTLAFNCVLSEMLQKAKLPDISGLSCIVLGEEDRLGDDIQTYLRAAGLEVLRIIEPAQIMSIAQPQNDDARVWIFDAFNIARWWAAMPVGVQPELRCVIIKRGLRRRPRVDEKNRISVDGNLLDRQALFKAVAIAAEREQEDKWSIEPGIPEAAFLLPLREHALQQSLILVAEDNDTNQKVIVRQLALLGYAADVVNNGREALERLQTQKYSLLLTDLHMPEIDGYELTTRIRAQEQAPDHLPIIALSANALRGEGARCRSLGMDDYLTKPASLAELQNSIERWSSNEVKREAILGAATEVEGAPVKLSILISLVGDDADVIEDFLRAFQHDTLRLATLFREAAATGNLTQLAAVAHKLKSSARSVGAQFLGEISADIEASAKAGESATLITQLPEFEHELALVNDYLQNRLNERKRIK